MVAPAELVIDLGPLERMPSDLPDAVADAIVTKHQQDLVSGAGPGGWRHNVGVRRVTPWSTAPFEDLGPQLQVVNEAVVWGRRTWLCEGTAATYLHIDDGAFFTEGGGKKEAAVADAMLTTVSRSMDSFGMKVSSQDFSDSNAIYVGYQPVSSPARLEPPAVKEYALDLALGHLLGRPRVHVDSLHSISSIWIWFALLARECLSVPHSLFYYDPEEQRPSDSLVALHTRRGEDHEGSPPAQLFPDRVAYRSSVVWDRRNGV